MYIMADRVLRSRFIVLQRGGSHNTPVLGQHKRLAATVEETRRIAELRNHAVVHKSTLQMLLRRSDWA